MTGEQSIPLPSLAAQHLIVFCRENGRVCPPPIPWNELWKRLCAVADERKEKRPPAPFILAVWSGSQTSPSEKAQRLREQIEWADAHGALQSAESFLRGLDESQWLHFGEWPA